MNILSRSEIGREAWNRFCDMHEGAWWWWRAEWLDYQAARGANDLSFGFKEEEDLVAICPLLLEEHGDRPTFTMEGHPGPRALSVRLPLNYLLEIFRLCEEWQVSRVAFRAHPFVPETVAIRNVEGWKDVSWRTQVLDLTQAVSDLWRGVRPSYHSLIHQAEKTHEILVDTVGNRIDAFRQLHAHVAGRETRPKATWDMMRRWCEEGNALHVCALLGGVVVACAYFEVYKRAAYYGHAASLHRNVNHALVWRAIQELKARGVQQLEMGWLDYPGEETRAVFRSGFGGQPVVIAAVERRF